MRRALRAIPRPAPLLLAALLALAAGACSREPGLPDFPAYAPTEPFLAEQELLQRRLAAEAARRERLRREALARGRPLYYAEWERIMEQGRRAQRAAEAARRAARNSEALARQRAAYYAEWRRIMLQAGPSDALGEPAP